MNFRSFALSRFQNRKNFYPNVWRCGCINLCLRSSIRLKRFTSRKVVWSTGLNLAY